MSSNQRTVYVIRICEYHNLFEKVTFDLPQSNSFNSQQIIQLLMKSDQSDVSSASIKTEDLTLYRIEKEDNYVYEKKFADNNQPENDDIFVIRYNMSQSFAGALHTYQALSNTAESANIKFIYRKMIEVGLPYFVAIKSDGACYYYAVLYGLFMTLLLDNTDAIPYLTDFSRDLTSFISNEHTRSIIAQYGYSVDDFTNSIEEIDNLKIMFTNIQSQSLNFQIKRFIFDSVISCYPNIMYSLRLALKCQWLNFLKFQKPLNSEIIKIRYNNGTVTFNDSINYNDEIEKILPKTSWTSDFLPTYVQNILGDTAPSVVMMFTLLNNMDNSDGVFKIITDQINKKSKANVAFTGGHYDVALTSDYAYDIAIIKDYINSANKFTIQSDVLTIDEQISQHGVIDELELERDIIFKDAVKNGTVENLANEPGINYLTSQSDFFSEGNKDFRTKLRNYIILKGAVELLENLMFSYFKKFPNAINLPQDLYGDLPEQPNNDASLNVKKAYLHEANPELYAKHVNNSSANWDIVWNANTNSSAAQPTTSNVATSAATPSATNVETSTAKPTTSNVENRVFKAWAELNVDGTVKQVVFDEPSRNVMILENWKNNPTNNKYVSLTFQLDEHGLSKDLNFGNISNIKNENLDVALSNIIKI